MKNSVAAFNLIRLTEILVVLVLLIWPAYFSEKIYAYFPFVAVLILVCMSVVLTLAARKKIRFASDYENAECERGMSVPISLNVFNDGYLIIPKAVAFLYVSDLRGNAETVTPAVFSMAARGAADFSFDIRMDHIGEYRAGIRSMELYDFLGLFRFPLGISEELTVSVLPRRREDLDFSLAEQSVAESMEQRNSVVSDGFDYSGVREYAMGDSMKRIHWKLSAHSPHYMTKLMETSMRNDLAIIMDPVAPAVDMETLACLYDCLVESTLSLAHSAANQEAEYHVYFYAKDHTVEGIVPRTREDEKRIIRDMMVPGSPGTGDNEDGPSIIRREAMISGGSSNLIMVTTSLYEELTDALIDIRRQGRNVHLVCILRHDMDSRERETAIFPLNALNEYDISCRIISADPPSEVA